MLPPHLRKRILDEALKLEGAPRVPRDRVRAQAFVQGPLRLVVKRRAGPAMARLLMEALRPLLPEPSGSQELPVIGDGDDEVTVDTQVHDPAALARLRERLRGLR